MWICFYHSDVLAYSVISRKRIAIMAAYLSIYVRYVQHMYTHKHITHTTSHTITTKIASGTADTNAQTYASSITKLIK
jgi:hypothetical protein